MTAECIFCLRATAASSLTDEHVVPDALGGNLVLRRLCKDCNDRAGRLVDALLVDNPLISILRFAMRLPNRDGRVPNPFAAGTLAEDPTVAARWHPESGAPGGTISVPFRVTEYRSESGRKLATLFPADKAALDAYKEKAGQRRGVKFGRIVETSRTFKSPRVKITRTEAASSILPPILKIAFELGHYWFGDAYLDDPCAEALRLPLARMMQAEDGVFSVPSNSIEAEIAYFPEDSQFARWSSRTSVHLAGIVVADERVFCALRIFNVVEGCVLISEHRSRYPHVMGDEALVFEPTSKTLRACAQPDLDDLLSEKETFRIEWACAGNIATVRVLDGTREAASVQLAWPGT